MPDGVYEAVDWNEFDGHDGPDLLLELRLRLEVDGSDLRFFYTGVPQIDAFVNSTMGPMFGQAMTGLMTLLVYGDLPVNGGLWRPITVDIGEPGTIVNSVAAGAGVATPTPRSACAPARWPRTSSARRCRSATTRSCAAASRGQHQDGFPGNALFGNNQHGGVSVIFYPDNAIGAGGGAQTINDGQDAYGLTCTTGGGIPDVENHEGADPVLFLWRGCMPNSGGPGQTRGGQALDQAYAIHYSDLMAGPGLQRAAPRCRRTAFGGGYPGSAGDFYPSPRHERRRAARRRASLPTRERFEGAPRSVRSKHHAPRRSSATTCSSCSAAAAAAWATRCCATPRAGRRGRHRRLRHRRPRATASTASCSTTTASLDDDGDRGAARGDPRASGSAASPSKRAAAPPPSLGISLARANGAWTCASCEERLADADGNWRDGAVLREQPIAERFDELEMHVRGPHGGARA